MAKRLSREDYFEVALDLLAKGGLGAVTLASMCEALEVTRGSFYYHFSGGIGDFMRQLLNYWAELVETITIDWRALTAEEVLHAVHDRAINSMNHEAEREIRAYGRTTPETNKVVAAVDARRRTNITRALEGAGVSPSDADALGRIGIALLIAEQQNVPVDREAMRVMYDEYLEWALAKLHRATDGVPVLAQGAGAAAEG
ncbi:TetR/AcrR family transcriptional regulator [Granulicoccus phenolivorans]|uniref:TetR/AcrR family transcriptional regulator n=1 Tax=Granulicoccus phenolivorans TaxID=266854 RepID=UPI000478BB7E|nr:TetR/AcrR family transcriptional regulator [Granulicoccus phenolivorans]